MRPRIKLSTFRKVARTEESMMRAMMPRTNAADPQQPAVWSVEAIGNSRQTERTLRVPMMEVAHGKQG